MFSDKREQGALYISLRLFVILFYVLACVRDTIKTTAAISSAVLFVRSQPCGVMLKETNANKVRFYISASLPFGFTLMPVRDAQQDQRTRCACHLFGRMQDVTVWTSTGNSQGRSNVAGPAASPDPH
jgi:hypothetical protein